MGNYGDQVQKLISLKRYETPRNGYFEDFLEEFQQRQRQELLKKSSLSLFTERAGTWFRELGSIKWVAGAGVAYAALTIGFVVYSSTTGSQADQNNVPVIYERSPAEPIPEVDFQDGSNFRSSQDSKREF
ncbi:hypothetical protein N9733_07195 [Akkermansiaceae bacterium]|nr:hypothetical protein [Akkermansiaceae bacterium]MDB4388097.1 hypothetical protein [Akkermansiaceae bacterium]MDB4569436.1 hypothetical protein [Akkermansiaceae bacterium]